MVPGVFSAPPPAPEGPITGAHRSTSYSVLPHSSHTVRQSIAHLHVSVAASPARTGFFCKVTLSSKSRRPSLTAALSKLRFKTHLHQRSSLCWFVSLDALQHLGWCESSVENKTSSVWKERYRLAKVGCGAEHGASWVTGSKTSLGLLLPGSALVRKKSDFEFL